MPKFPDFIIVGCMKCGTTATWHNLNKHPQVTMGKNKDDPKKVSTEIRFWRNARPYYNYNKGLEWYKNIFDGYCCGEKDANMISSKKAMGLLYAHVPNIKVILMIREPVMRTYSEFYMNGRKGDFKYVFKKNKDIIHKSNYIKQIKKNILPFFPKKNLLIVINERMKADLNVEINRIYSFLGIEYFDQSIDKMKFSDRDSNNDKYRVWSSNYKPLDVKTRISLGKIFIKCNEELYDFLGYRIKEWEVNL